MRIGRDRRRFTRPAAAGGGGGIDPTSFSGLYLWTRADLGITIDTGVSVWADQSGNGRDFVQATGGLQPSYTSGTPGYLDFNGAGVVMTSEAAADWTFLHNGDPSTIVMVVYTTGASGHLLDTSADGTKPGVSISRDGSDIFYSIYNAGFYIGRQYQAVTASAWHCLALRQDQGHSPDDYTFWVDNTVASSADYELFGSPGVPSLLDPASTLGLMNAAGGGSNVVGRCAEVIIYNSYLSDAELTSLYDDYLTGQHSGLP